MSTTDLHPKVTAFSDKRCGYWNLTSNDWSFEGCDLIVENEDLTICQCDHLTNFGVIMDINGNLDDNVSYYLLVMCSSFSS